MQRAGGGVLRPESGHGLPDSPRRPDPAALLMLLLDAEPPEPVRSGARELALFLTPEPGAEAKEVEDTVESMLLGLEEFCSLADMIRSDTSQILEENIPLLKAKVTEMRGIYAKVDQLELPANGLGKQQKMAQVPGPTPMWETRMELQALALAWPSLGRCGRLGSEPEGLCQDGRAPRRLPGGPRASGRAGPRGLPPGPAEVAGRRGAPLLQKQGVCASAAGL
nr:breast carcinoma-amplified sequence 4 isoform X4 [Oryctolagus cuniculus]